MEIWQAIVIGAVQGLTEFLPVSSSGHILLFEKWMGIDAESGGMFLGVMLHAGTLLSLIAVYYREILNLFKPPFRRLGLLMVASIPAAAAGLLLGDKIEAVFYGGNYLFIGFYLTAVILFITEIRVKRDCALYEVDKKRALITGLAQAVAVLPGISRSGACIAAATLSGVRKDEAAQFAFLMSLPVITGAVLLEVVKCPSFGGDLPVLLCAALSAAVFGYIAICGMIKLVGKANYKVFSVYLVIVGTVSLFV